VKGAPGCLKQMMDAYNDVGGSIIAVDEVPEADVSKYGVIAPKGTMDGPLIEMSGMVEKPAIKDAPSRYKITGRYILQPKVMELLATQDTGAGGEIQLTDAMARAMEGGSPFHAFAYEGQDYDCGSKLGYFEAVLAHALDHPEIADGARALVKSVKS
jgi:UTP--glucose-1-phosphate uridylyltransferase